jgi:hypothetical protein
VWCVEESSRRFDLAYIDTEHGVTALVAGGRVNETGHCPEPCGRTHLLHPPARVGPLVGYWASIR